MSIGRSPTVKRRIKHHKWKKQGRKCYWCQKSPGRGIDGVTFDHVIPRALGGPNAQTNLVLACVECNQAHARLVSRYLQGKPVDRELVFRRPTAVALGAGVSIRAALVGGHPALPEVPGGGILAVGRVSSVG